VPGLLLTMSPTGQPVALTADNIDLAGSAIVVE